MSISIILFRVYRYFLYWLYKMDLHSLHSPFVYSLYKDSLKVCRQNILPIPAIEELRIKFQENSMLVPVTSNEKFSDKRQKKKRISSISLSGISSLGTSKILTSLISFSSAKKVLELGTSLGINTMYLAKNNVVERVTTVDSNQALVDMARSNFQELGMSNINSLCSDVDDFLDEAESIDQLFDFFFLDANHTMDATIRYFEKCKKISSVHSVMVFDDINWSSEMKDAWHLIKSQCNDQLVIENYQFGIVFSQSWPAKGAYILDF